jgi:hypothetical protein
MSQPIVKVGQFKEIKSNSDFGAGNGVKIMGFNTDTQLVESVLVDLSNYYTKAEVDDAIAAIDLSPYATTSDLSAAISGLIGGAPALLDTLSELADAINDDENYFMTVTNELAGKLTASNNLSDVANAATARSNIGAGTVSSVAMTVPGTIYDISGSPITGSGTLALSLKNQNANTVFAGPSTGAAAAPTFRSLVAADIPSLSSVYLPLAGGTLTGALNGTTGTFTSGGFSASIGANATIGAYLGSATQSAYLQFGAANRIFFGSTTNATGNGVVGLGRTDFRLFDVWAKTFAGGRATLDFIGSTTQDAGSIVFLKPSAAPGTSANFVTCMAYNAATDATPLASINKIGRIYSADSVALKDTTNGHYYKITMVSGVLTTTDLGTTLPA